MRTRGFCVSCKKDKKLTKLTECRMCDSTALYCIDDECADCQQPCVVCEQQQPGRWACGGEGHILNKMEETFKCMICDEWEYCLKHITMCSCGLEHYFCKSCKDEYRCRFEMCKVYLCPESGQLLQDVPESTFCDAHVPQPFKKRLVDLVNK
jgi:hypothetical protein